MIRTYLSIPLLTALLVGCATQSAKPESTQQPATPPSSAGYVKPAAVPVQQPVQVPAVPSTPASPAPATAEPPAPQTAQQAKGAPFPMPWLKVATFRDLPGWKEEDPSEAWSALLESCKGLKSQPTWTRVCQAATQQKSPSATAARSYFEQHFQPYQIFQAEGGTEGLVTGYYEPLLRGSRTPDEKYRYPLYAPPEDLLVVDLSSLYPELKNLRLRGRLQGKRVVPYFTRAEIEGGSAPMQGKELVWVDDAVELFFLQVQGSGRVQLESGEILRLGYADQNGHPYRSIGKWLVEKGELTLDRASMQGIKDWALRNPEKLPELLNANPSYVFFRELPNQQGGPLGALGVPLTAERSIAIDPRAIPLGAPVWLATTRPNSPEPLNRLMLAQDTGGAIRGNVRADFFWGFGEAAGHLAGAMKQKGRMWVLLPKDYPLNGPN